MTDTRDLVERLRTYWAPELLAETEDLFMDAADEIERLRAAAKETEDQLCIVIAEKIDLRVELGDEIERLRAQYKAILGNPAGICVKQQR